MLGYTVLSGGGNWSYYQQKMADKATDSFTFSYIVYTLTFSFAPPICRWINGYIIQLNYVRIHCAKRWR